MALFFKPPPPPPAPVADSIVTQAEMEKFAAQVTKHLHHALSTLAALLQEASGNERESLICHHYISETLVVFGDPKYEALWPIFYPTSQFETNLL